uniref:Endoplasmic reticulum-golgi intermediate compartment protein 3-like n=1 Tax=Tetraselmis sp. GSL018 TaxID=582737 RepID=A0A061RHV7_9CHLO
MKVLKKLAAFSAYARAEEHLVKQTYSGALVTIAGCVLALFLFIHELQYYLKTDIHTEMGVDKTRREKLRISFNITFPALPCEVLTLNTVDAAGKHESDLATDGDIVVHKYRLDRFGMHMDDEEYVPSFPLHVIDAARGVQLDPQAKKDQEMIQSALDNFEGCNIFGYLDVMRVSGSFHIGMHSQTFIHLRQTQRNIIDAIRRFRQALETGRSATNNVLEIVHDTTLINVSHYIHELRFGPNFPGRVNPLDGFERVVDHDSGAFKYFLKVVPTEYHFLSGATMKTNQYSVNEYFHNIGHNEGSLPSVQFSYDLSAIAVSIRERRRSLAHFAVQVCAVVGGAFAITGMIDRWVYSALGLLSPS